MLKKKKTKKKKVLSALTLTSEEFTIHLITKWERCERKTVDGAYVRCPMIDMCTLACKLIDMEIYLPFGLPLSDPVTKDIKFELPIDCTATGRGMVFKDEILYCLFIDGYGYIDKARINRLLMDLRKDDPELITGDILLIKYANDGRVVAID